MAHNLLPVTLAFIMDLCKNWIKQMGSQSPLSGKDEIAGLTTEHQYFNKGEEKAIIFL